MRCWLGGFAVFATLQAVLLAMLSVYGQAGSEPAWVAVDELHVHVEPDDASPTTSILKRGARVRVLERLPWEWLAIEPPEHSFSWIARDAVEELGEGRAQVVAKAAAARPGIEGAALPAGLWTVVPAGTTVELLDLPPLVIRQPGGQRRVWYAIKPPREERRYIRADGVEAVDGRLMEGGAVGLGGDGQEVLGSDRSRGERTRRASRLGVSELSRSSDLLEVGPATPELGLPRFFEESLARVEARHRAVLAGPIESWQLDQTRSQYEALRAQASSLLERNAVALRLGQLDRQERGSASARKIAELLARSHRRDDEVEAIRRRVGDFATGREAPFEAEGLLQTTSALVDGRRVYVLIDDEGRTGAYLVIPPGLNVEPYLTARVGVRGESRFHATRKSRVITVREIELLDERP